MHLTALTLYLDAPPVMGKVAVCTAAQWWVVFVRPMVWNAAGCRVIRCMLQCCVFHTRWVLGVEAARAWCGAGVFGVCPCTGCVYKTALADAPEASACAGVRRAAATCYSGTPCVSCSVTALYHQRCRQQQPHSLPCLTCKLRLPG
jgi:hypothetical protein